MRYVSTRGKAPALNFAGVLLAGLADDGGLYVPKNWPKLTKADIAGLSGRPYAEVATEIMARFTGPELPAADLAPLVTAAYRNFGHPAVAPLRQIDAGECTDPSCPVWH